MALMRYNLTTPLAISPALTPGITIDDFYWLTLTFTGRDDEGRVTTECSIFGPGETFYEGEGPSSGCGATADDALLRELFETALIFLLSDAEQYQHSATGRGAYSFGQRVAGWAYEHSLALNYARWDFHEEEE